MKLKVIFFLLFSFAFLKVPAQKNKAGLFALLGTGNSPSGYWGAGGFYNLLKDVQIATGFGFTFASGHKINFDFRYIPGNKNELSPVLCISYSYLLKGTKDYGEGLNNKRNFKYSSGNNIELGAGLNLNLTNLVQSIDRQVNILIIGGYCKFLGNFKITPVEPINYNQSDYDAIKKNLFKSGIYFNIGAIVQLN